MRQNDKRSLVILGLIEGILLCYSGFQLFYGGPMEPYWRDKATWSMMFQLLLFFVWNYGCLKLLPGPRIRSAAMAGAVFVFAWCHQILLPLAVSGIYMLYLLGMGRMARKFMDHETGASRYSIEKGLIDFLIGSALWICMVCLMSVMGIGSIGYLRILTVITGALSAIWNLSSRPDLKELSPGKGSGGGKGAVAAFVLILTMLMLQAGRMNVALDYDSLHYGLRTPYILNNGGGIYENLGNINLVYTYTKGLETLVMPLSGTSTYGFVLSFNLWVTLGILLLTYSLVTRLSDQRYGLAAAAILSSIPGLMNMAATAKSDCITLLFQLAFIYFTVIYLKQDSREARMKYFILSGCSCVMTYLFKPTALVFSTVAFGVGFCWLFGTRQLFMKVISRWWFCVIPVFGALTGLWARTWVLTGVPVTSVFTSVFEILGFQVKEPFAFLSIPSNGGSDILESLNHLLRRLFYMLTAPVGADMDHVVIAWGTPAVLLLSLLLVWGISRKKRQASWQERQTKGYLTLMTGSILAVSLVSIYKLWQVDGNYFMLLYALVVIQAVLSVRYWGTVDLWKTGRFLIIPVVLFNVAVTCMSNWAGVPGFSPVRFFHGGYYDHLEEARLEKADEGNEAIWNLLARDPSTRVLAIGQHPEVLSFPCNVQSYYDLTGSGGNVFLVKTLDNFKGFLRYAKTEYIYVQAGYMEPDTRVWDIVNYMIEDGSLADIKYEYGNMLAKVNLDGRIPATPKQSLREFRLTYIPKDIPKE